MYDLEKPHCYKRIIMSFGSLVQPYSLVPVITHKAIHRSDSDLTYISNLSSNYIGKTWYSLE